MGHSVRKVRARQRGARSFPEPLLALRAAGWQAHRSRSLTAKAPCAFFPWLYGGGKTDGDPSGRRVRCSVLMLATYLACQRMQMCARRHFFKRYAISGRQSCSLRLPARCRAASCAFQARAGTARRSAAAAALRAALHAGAYGKWGSKRTGDRKCPRACRHILKVGGNLQTAKQDGTGVFPCV